jgi:hypothetical protein
MLIDNLSWLGFNFLELIMAELIDKFEEFEI